MYQQMMELEEAMKGKKLAGRHLKRLQGIKLSGRGYPVAAIAELLEVHSNSVRNWLRRYEDEGLSGLEERKRQGRPKLLNEEQEAQLKCWVEQEPRQIKQVLAKVEKELKLRISMDTLKRSLKRGATAIGE